MLSHRVNHHYGEDELVLYYYGEGRHRTRVARHLEQCDACRAAYASLAAALGLVSASAGEIPQRGDQYGLEVWQRIRHRLPERERVWWPNVFASFEGRLAALAGVAALAAVAALVVGAFFLGRAWPDTSTPVDGSAPPPVARVIDPPEVAPALASAVADHLERSERLLTDVMNASSQRDLAAERSWAADLVSEGRLYRREVEATGDEALASVLDDLERNLLEVVHSPSPISAAALADIRNRIDAAALLFKVRVLGDELREQQRAADPYVRQTSTPKAG